MLIRDLDSNVDGLSEEIGSSSCYTVVMYTACKEARGQRKVLGTDATGKS